MNRRQETLVWSTKSSWNPLNSSDFNPDDHASSWQCFAFACIFDMFRLIECITPLIYRINRWIHCMYQLINCINLLLMDLWLGIFGLGALAWDCIFWIFDFGSVAGDLGFWIFCFVSLAWDPWLGVFGLGWWVWGIGILRLGQPAGGFAWSSKSCVEAF